MPPRYSGAQRYRDVLEQSLRAVSRAFRVQCLREFPLKILRSRRRVLRMPFACTYFVNYSCIFVQLCCGVVQPLLASSPSLKEEGKRVTKGFGICGRKGIKELKKALKKSSYFIEYTYVYSSAVRPSTHATRRIDYTLPSHWAAAAAARAGDGAGTEVVVHGGE